MVFPRFVPVSQIFPHPHINDVAGKLTASLKETGLSLLIKHGDAIAVTAGSRGIAQYPLILRTLIDELKRSDAKPFIVPAMGSHGGGTAQGQIQVLASLGITEASMGVPVRASMETIVLDKTANNIPVYCDRLAYESDGIVALNRIKVHTAFHSDIESGLSKMLAVGLGKVEGAEAMHHHGLAESIPAAASIICDKAPVRLGIGLLENAYDEIMDIRIALPGQFTKTDQELLSINRLHVPHIPIKEFDILIVDEMGKDISGTGMDTNVIGFWRRYGGQRDPVYETLIVRSLTSSSNGNAMGVGMADMITRKLADMVDLEATKRNAITSQPELGILPPVCKNDRECIEAAFEQCACSDPRIVRIRNTRNLSKFWVSENLIAQIIDKPNISIESSEGILLFDSDGNLEDDIPKHT